MTDRNGEKLHVGDWVKFKPQNDNSRILVAEIIEFGSISEDGTTKLIPGVYLNIAPYLGVDSFFGYFYNVERISEEA